MAPAMKLTLKYEEGDDDALHTTIKLTLPRKWKEGPSIKLKESFVETFNGKHGDKLKLELGQVHLINTAGHALADDDVVVQSLSHGEHVRIKHGPPPKRVHRPSGDAPAGPAGARPISKAAIPTPTPIPAGKDGLVSSAAALEAARQPSRAFDYSKWDRLDLSDDDGDDCHPNIDKESWKRLMKQKRADRRKQEDDKIAAYKAKIEKHSKRAAEIQAKIDAGDDDAQLLVDVKDAQDSAASYQAKLDKFLASRKLTADDVAQVSLDHTVVSEKADLAPLLPGAAPDAAPGNSPNSTPSVKPEPPRDEALEYDDYIKRYREPVDKYARLRSDEASEAFLFEHPEILHEHAEGYLLLLTLDKCMEHLTKKAEMGDAFSAKHEKRYKEEELAIARQHLLIQFVLTLSKGKKCDPRDMIKPFFRKTSKQYEDRIEGFEDDLAAFVERIRNRAAEKISKGERSPLAGPIHQGEAAEEEEAYEPAGLGPGGLDPNEVLPTLPEAMQEAFVSQDVEALKKCLLSLSEEEGNYHMQRCIASGLWQPGPNDEPWTDEAEAEAEVE